MADPDEGSLALFAARAALITNDNIRSGAWYARAIGLAGDDHDLYIRAQLGYGGVMADIVSYGKASRAFRRASRLAIKYGRRGLAAQANHDLVEIALRTGAFAEGVAAAESALERYPIRHPRLLHLAIDFSALLMDAGYFASAILLLEQMKAGGTGPERIIIAASLARSAGAVGDREIFGMNKDDVLHFASPSSEDYRIAALLLVGTGAYSLGENEVATACANQARVLAEGAGLFEQLSLADTLIREIATGAVGDGAVAATAAPLAVQVLIGRFRERLGRAGR